MTDFMTDDGIILQISSYREYDQLVTFYFRRNGKMTVVARGAKRSRKRFIGLISKFNHIGCELKKGKRSTLMELEEGSLISAPMANAKTFESLIYGSYLLDLVLNFTRDQHANSQLFEIILSAISGLAENRNPEGLIRRFEWNILTITGYRPELNNCVRCRNIRGQNKNATFYIQDGGIVCRVCKSDIKNGYPLSSNTIKLLINHEEIVDERAKKELGSILPEFIIYQLGRSLPSLPVLEELLLRAAEPTLSRKITPLPEMREEPTEAN